MSTRAPLQPRSKRLIQPTDYIAAELECLAFFRGIKPEHLQSLARCATRTEFAAGDHILHTGNKANRFYLIETGQVSVQTTTPAGRQLGIQLLGPGDILGWSWIYPTYVWSFDAKAQTSGDAIFFHANQIRAECERDDALACALFKRMAKVMLSRLHHMQQGLVHLADHQWPLATPMA